MVLPKNKYNFPSLESNKHYLCFQTDLQQVGHLQQSHDSHFNSNLEHFLERRIFPLNQSRYSWVISQKLERAKTTTTANNHDDGNRVLRVIGTSPILYLCWIYSFVGSSLHKHANTQIKVFGVRLALL